MNVSMVNWSLTVWNVSFLPHSLNYPEENMFWITQWNFNDETVSHTTID